MSKDSRRKGFNLPPVSSVYDDWFEFKKKRPVTAMVLSEMFETPETVFISLKKEFTEMDMIALTPYTPYRGVNIEQKRRIVEPLPVEVGSTFPDNG